MGELLNHDVHSTESDRVKSIEIKCIGRSISIPEKLILIYWINFSAEEKLTVEELLKHYVHPTESDPVKRIKLKSIVAEGMENLHIFLKVERQAANNVKYV